MIIQWNNGESSILPFIELRLSCKCAACVDEWTRERKVKRGDIKPDIKPMAIEVVGRYAIQIKWSDGHGSGIYPFDQIYLLASHLKEAHKIGVN
jgi:DUF971 family protein